MAWVHCYGLVAPAAAGQIHWGATSCYVTDNADLILMRDGLDIVINKMASAVEKLSTFAKEWKDLPCLGYTHLQPVRQIPVLMRNSRSSLTTCIGTIDDRRQESLCLDSGPHDGGFIILIEWPVLTGQDLRAMQRVRDELCFRGVKGTTGS